MEQTGGEGGFASTANKLAAAVTTGDAATVCPDDGDDCIEDFAAVVICVVKGDAAGAWLDDGDDCTREFGICAVVGTGTPFPPTDVDIGLTIEVTLTLEVVLAALVINPERPIPNSDESRLGRRALRADTSSASSDTETGSPYMGPE